MTPVYTKDQCYHYVSYSDLIKFIEENSKLCYNEVTLLVEENDILDYDNGKISYSREHVFRCGNSIYMVYKYNWIRDFFEAHTFMNKIMFVFDD